MRSLLPADSSATSRHASRGLHRTVCAVSLAVATMLSACSGYKPPPPSPLQPNPATVAAHAAWTQRLAGGVNFPLHVAAVDGRLIMADASGDVMALDATTGSVAWRTHVASSLVAGVGTDGTTSAVVSGSSELIAIRNGMVAWKVPLASQSYTAPLVAGGRVFVVNADRSIAAYDAGNGYRLWQQKARAGNEDNLVLKQDSLLMAAGGGLLVGVAGRIVAFNPDNGAPLGEVTLAIPRGVDEVARMSDVVAPASRVGNSLCARTFQANVACADYGKSAIAWSQPSDGTSGISGDARIVVGADSLGDVVAWSRADGKQLWKNTTFRHRGLSAPLVMGDNVLVADAQGYVHVLDAADGELRNRVATDGAPIQVAPVAAGRDLAVVVGAKGTVSAIRLQ